MIVIHPGKHDFEAKNPGALFVALSRAKSACGEGRDPDFAFHEDVLINDDRFNPGKSSGDGKAACISKSVSSEGTFSTSI